MNDQGKAVQHAPRLTGGRALYSVAAWLRFVVPAVGGLVLDLWTKAYAFPHGVLPEVVSETARAGQGRHPHEPPLTIIPNVLGFQTTVNHGAVFGIGQGQGWLFIAFSFVALGAILLVFAKSYRKQIFLHTALGLITAGALGNLYDRMRFDGVRDMLKFLCFQFQRTMADGTIRTVDYYPYIFNVADVLLCVGVPLLMIVWLFAKEPEQTKPGD